MGPMYGLSLLPSPYPPVAVFALFCAFALVTISTPAPKDVALSKRSNGDDVLAILTTVKSDTDNVLPQIGMPNWNPFG